MLHANFGTWRGHTVGMCRTLTATGCVVSQLQNHRCSSAITRGTISSHAWRGDVGSGRGARRRRWQWRGGSKCSTRLATTASGAVHTLQRKQGSITPNTHNTVLFFFTHSGARHLSHENGKSKANTDTERRKKALVNNIISRHFNPRVPRSKSAGYRQVKLNIYVTVWEKSQSGWAI